MSDGKPNYNILPCPGIGAISPCKPEVWEFTVREGRACVAKHYRAVLLGKKGHPGWLEEPVVCVERADGEDALGVATWRSCGDEIDISVVAQLLIAVRGDCK